MDKINLEIPGIKACQQNRHPLLFIDKIIDTTPGKEANSLKCFSYNEWFFPAHFDDEPNVPGFIQVECLVQTFIMTFLCIEEYRGMKTNFASINNVQFKRKIVPGETLEINANLSSFRMGIAKGFVESFVKDEKACSAEFMVTVPDILDKYKPPISS